MDAIHLPNAITLPGIAIGLAFSLLLPPGIIAAALGALIGGGSLWAIGEVYYRFSGQEGMGGGDVKMLAMIGAFLGWKLAIVTLVFSSIAGALIGLLILAIRKGGLKYALPYGTFLALGALIAVGWPEPGRQYRKLTRKPVEEIAFRDRWDQPFVR